MSLTPGWSPFGPTPQPKVPKKAPVEAPPPSQAPTTATVLPFPPRPAERSDGALAAQIGAALRDQGTYTPAVLASACGLTPNTLVRCFAGSGMRVTTLESLCRAMGWTITVTDEAGNEVATGPAAED